MKLSTQSHVEQRALWPQDGKHVLAHHDANTIIVYQAYRAFTAAHAVRHGKLGGPDFSFNRMSWIKPNFLWMMYRSGWATKEGQEHVLGFRLRRSFFDALMTEAVPSSFDPDNFASSASWKCAVEGSDVRRQWDPDHSPSGGKLNRRAIQLGLRGERLHAFATTEILEVIDMTAFVAVQRHHAQDDDPQLEIPVESVYVQQRGG